MDLNLIKKLVKVVDSSEITDLEVEENGFRVKIAKKIRMGTSVIQPQILSPTTSNNNDVVVHLFPILFIKFFFNKFSMPEFLLYSRFINLNSDFMK